MMNIGIYQLTSEVSASLKLRTSIEELCQHQKMNYYFHNIKHKVFNQNEERKKIIEKKTDRILVISDRNGIEKYFSFFEDLKIPYVFIPSSIENDVFGTELSLGYDSALNYISQMIRNLTLYKNEKICIIEVPGRDYGLLALESGLIGGADEILIPEIYEPLDKLAERVAVKESCLIVTSEGQKIGRCFDLAEGLRKRLNSDSQIVILGPSVKSCPPTAQDLILALRFGIYALQSLLQGASGVLIGVQESKVLTINLKETHLKTKKLPEERLNLMRYLFNR